MFFWDIEELLFLIIFNVFVVVLLLNSLVPEVKIMMVAVKPIFALELLESYRWFVCLDISSICSSWALIKHLRIIDLSH